MDPKAAAKSKRSHTVHGRRVHQTPAAAAAHRQKRAAAAATSSGPRSRNLPSNWDRYDDEGEAEDPAAAGEWTGEVAPLSKGADFGFLLEQARAQPRGALNLSAPCLPSQDLPFDFMQASTSMLEAKGEGILSWCADDNFILEDDLAPDFEVPFLSMDLNALANHLSKIRLSRRLFIEEDLFPEDMADALEDNEIAIDLDTSLEIDAKGSSVGHNLNSEPRKDTSHLEYASNICADDQMKTERQPQCFARETTASPKISTHSVNSDSEEDKSYKQIMDTDPGTSHSKGLMFEVGAAEEELDLLLNSFGGTHLSSSNLDKPFEHISTLQEISRSNEKVELGLSSRPPLLAPLDDALDDLLSETSHTAQNEGFAMRSITSQPTVDSGQNIHPVHLFEPVRTSHLLTVFSFYNKPAETSQNQPPALISSQNQQQPEPAKQGDLRYTKKIDVTPSIDDSVDDLLEGTSSCLNEPKQTTNAQASNSTPLDSVPLHSGPLNASASDDFDSWFDSL